MTIHSNAGAASSEEEDRIREEEERVRSGSSIGPTGSNAPLSDEELDEIMGYAKKNREILDANKDADDAQKIGDAGATELTAEEEVRRRNSLPVAGGGYGEGAFGTLRNEDLSGYREKREAERRAASEARRASSVAMAERRQELLASGQYYDDGRGNLRMKKANREYVEGVGRNRHVRTAADDGSGNAAIRAAGQDAWAAAIAGQQDAVQDKASEFTRSAVQMNRDAVKAAELRKAESARMASKSRLSVFDGFAAALDMMKSSEAQEEVKSVWGGKDENGRDGRWTYDAQGRVVGQAGPRDVKTGFSVKRGFVTPELLKNINARLNERGASYNITGIMAKQTIGAIGKPLDGKEPQFYVQGVRNDGSKFGQMMTLKDVYRWGVSAFKDSGGEGDAQEFAINALGGYDPDGYRKTPEYVSRGAKASSEKTKSEAEQFALSEAKKGAKFNSPAYVAVSRELANLHKVISESGGKPTEAQQKRVDELTSVLRNIETGSGVGGTVESNGSGDIFSKGAGAGAGGKGGVTATPTERAVADPERAKKQERAVEIAVQEGYKRKPDEPVESFLSRVMRERNAKKQKAEVVAPKKSDPLTKPDAGDSGGNKPEAIDNSEKKVEKNEVEPAKTQEEAVALAKKLGKDKVGSMTDDEIERLFRGGFSKVVAGTPDAIRAILGGILDSHQKTSSVTEAVKSVARKAFGGSGRPRMK